MRIPGLAFAVLRNLPRGARSPQGTLVFLLLAAGNLPGDWPTYRHDMARTGATEEPLATPLALDWLHQPRHGPEPAWPPPATRPREGISLRNRVGYDEAFQVAVANGLVFFGSSADHQVYALDLSTGEIRWSFFTEGPVRLAPSVWQNRVFVGSDDGVAYCLDAAQGTLIWKQSGAPNPEKLLGHGRMISRWPIRTGLLVDNGTVYFGAGIFPHETVYLYALRAEDGTLVWKNDTLSPQGADRDDFSPQGYLLASPSRLFAPAGRDLPAAFDRANGSLVFHRAYGWRSEQTGGVVGGTYALLADDQIYTGTQEHLLALNQENGQAGFAWFPGRKLTVAGALAFLATGREIIAMDRIAYARASHKRNALEFKIKNLQSSLPQAQGDQKTKLENDLKAARQELAQHTQKEIAPTIQWRTPSPCDAELIASHNLVIAGGKDEVVALNIENGDRAWSSKVDGRAAGLAVANGRLVVSTDRGSIYSFAPENTAQGKTISPRSTPNPYPEDELTPAYAAAAEAILWNSGVKKGYGLILGAERGRLAWELARRTELSIVGIEPDPEKVQAAREALHQAGLYGRVVIQQGNLEDLPYSSYFANLIVSDRLLLTGKMPGNPAQVKRHLKPWGGVVCLGSPPRFPQQTQPLALDPLNQWLAKMELGPCRNVRSQGNWAILQRGPLPGAGQWTHQYAGPGNTACSDEQLVSGSLGVLWFGQPGSAPMVNRHNAAAGPLALNGRLFIQGEEVVMAYDSSNGTELWTRNLPGAMRTSLRGSECGNLAASDDSIYVALDDRCLRLDAETGQTRATYPLPAPSTSQQSWGYLAHLDGILYGSTRKSLGVSDSVFAIHTATGQLLWQYRGKNIINLSIAAGDGWLFFVDSSLSPEQRQAFLRQNKSPFRSLQGPDAAAAAQELKKSDLRLAVALDARTGGTLWAAPVDVTDCSKIGIGGGQLTAMYQDGVVLLCGANANGHYWKQFLAGEFSERRLLALAAHSGQVLWAKDANYRHRPVIIGDSVLAEPWLFDLKTGRQKTRPHPITGLEEPWQFLRPGHHCGAISACPQMLFMRSGCTGYYDLRDDSGIRHFAGQRLGCWINAIPANGLALIPEASAGCLCLHPVNCTLVMEPRPDRRRWGIYSTGGPNTPVERLALNFGAPGDQRDPSGQMWFSYPRPSLPGDRAAMGLSLSLTTEFLQGGRYDAFHGESLSLTNTDIPWVYTSWGRGLSRCVVPLLNDGTHPALYTVRLLFAVLKEVDPAPLNIRIQQKDVATNLNLAEQAGGLGQPLVLEFPNVSVAQNLEIELIPQGPTETPPTSSIRLCGLEVVRVGPPTTE